MGETAVMTKLLPQLLAPAPRIGGHFRSTRDAGAFAVGLRVWGHALTWKDVHSGHDNHGSPECSWRVHLIDCPTFIERTKFSHIELTKQSHRNAIQWEIGMTQYSKISPSFCEIAKWAFTTRRVDRSDVKGISQKLDSAKAGDLILCEIAEIGHHKKIQLAERRVSVSYPGDLVVLCLGDRYAPDQFLASAIVDDDLIDLVAGGGVAGRVDAAHIKMEDPTRLKIMGLLTNAEGKVMNVADYALPTLPANDRVTVIGVFGASMNSGKTTAASSLAHGLIRSGYAVAGVKATGTGAFGDFNSFEDGGAPATDFTDVGMATTFRMPMERIESGFDTLVATAAQWGAEVVVVEIADGVFQQETKAILESSRIRDRLDGILFAAPDALSALGGVTVLEKAGLDAFAISGMVSCSPLATAEAAEVTNRPILSREDLWSPEVIAHHVAPLMRPESEGMAA